jgi:hypothetical protein
MFSLRLTPVEEQDKQTRLFGELQKTCKEDALTRHKHNDWISEESWQLIAHRAMLRCTGRLCQTGGVVYIIKLAQLFAMIGLTKRLWSDQ